MRLQLSNTTVSACSKTESNIQIGQDKFEGTSLELFTKRKITSVVKNTDLFFLA